MNKDSQVALRGYPGLTGKVTGIDGSDALVQFDSDDRTVRHPVAELVEITDHPLPDDDKSWPPPDMETKARPT